MEQEQRKDFPCKLAISLQILKDLVFNPSCILYRQCTTLLELQSGYSGGRINMTGLHDDTWVRSFVPEATKEIMQNVDAGISSRGQSPLTETRGISG